MLYVALDPVFVSQTAQALEIYPDRVEVIEQHRETDPVFQSIALALCAGALAGSATDAMYGDSLSTALAVHLLREYGGISVRPQHAHRGLSREKLTRAVAYIQDQLQTDLTVSGIARSVHMSPYHFTRLFKKSTGQSPTVMSSKLERGKPKNYCYRVSSPSLRLLIMSVLPIRVILHVTFGSYLE